MTGCYCFNSKRVLLCFLFLWWSLHGDIFLFCGDLFYLLIISSVFGAFSLYVISSIISLVKHCLSMALVQSRAWTFFHSVRLRLWSNLNKNLATKILHYKIFILITFPFFMVKTTVSSKIHVLLKQRYYYINVFTLLLF